MMKGLTKTAGSIALLACLLFTVGCTPQAAAQPTADVNAIQTAAAGTVVAQITSDAALTPSATPVPPTETSIPATATQAVTATQYVVPTAAATATTAPTIKPTIGITFTLVPVPFRVTLMSISPATNAIFKPGDSFDGVVTFRNDGTATWTNKYHVRWVSGDGMGSTSRYYLGGNVRPGETVSVTVDCLAPGTDGSYDGVYQFFDDNNSVIYTFHVIIKVQS